MSKIMSMSVEARLNNHSNKN